MKIIGLTGGIGSGKTTVAKMFEELGVPIYNSDLEAKKLMHTSKTIRKKLVDLFGETAYQEGKLNRAYIAQSVFNDPKLLKRLNKIVHPVVRKHFVKWSETQNAPYVIQETALLFENNAQGLYDKVILVTAPTEVRIKRLLERDNATREEILARMNNQLEDSKKLPLADYVIENIDLEKTSAKVDEIHSRILDFS
ncbi:MULTISPECIES: dephospho-CoA kinase [Maribacter]|uniref:Dephospho-CoA kinase n=1 Tax=Maribacter flavus TaxID=1658664 RepID=A0ABU7IIQ0_9FLAO|nr:MULTISPECIES: dephospho-CoA kinase [Maribacter]MDC6405529.1 dephospho-CoA kinase [Maribacter sp. PR66]MEE1972703.1 dephospho-CoA kinase [Maribacter flavus]